MTSEEIKAEIDKRIKENKQVLEEVSEKVEELYTLSKAKKSLTITLELASMKDRSLFHKAIVIAYEDLLQEIDKC